MSEVKITYETLFDLLRREKNTNELQQLDEHFYTDVLAYLEEKQNQLSSDNEKYNDPEKDKIKTQIQNIKRILKELYELREKKILHLAMDKVRTESQLIDTTPLLAEEKKFYNQACKLLNKYKTGILEQLQQGKEPIIDVKKENITTKEPSEQTGSNKTSPEPEETTDKAENETQDDKEINVKILHDLPKFVGKDKEIYGPYEENQVVTLPKKVAQLLIDKGRAKKE